MCKNFFEKIYYFGLDFLKLPLSVFSLQNKLSMIPKEATTLRPKPIVPQTEKPEVNVAGAAAGAFMAENPAPEPESEPDTTSEAQSTVQVKQVKLKNKSKDFKNENFA